MRLLHIFNDDRNARTFTSYLLQQGIQNKLEIDKNTDWGSPEYGNVICKVWIIEEDDLDSGKECLDLFLEKPDDERFKRLRPVSPHLLKAIEEAPIIEMETPRAKNAPPQTPAASPAKPLGFVTLYLIIICTALLFASLFTSRPPEAYPSNLPPAPLFLSNTIKVLDYDYPYAYEIIDKIINAYGFDKIIHPQSLPPEGQILLKQFHKTPYWKGGYDKLVAYLKSPGQPIPWNEPMFEKIQKGQLWRLFTPCLLHAGIFHLFFNMLWLLVLGKQMEQRLGIIRYILFILMAAIFSNTAQYLVSGSNFMGFSGVLCAMIVFVWIRQKKSPWEGYQLLPSTMGFISGFILIVAALQLFSFFLEITGQQGLSLPIANTAHLAGAFAGFIFAQLNYFSWKF